MFPWYSFLVETLTVGVLITDVSLVRFFFAAGFAGAFFVTGFVTATFFAGVFLSSCLSTGFLVTSAFLTEIAGFFFCKIADFGAGFFTIGFFTTVFAALTGLDVFVEAAFLLVTIFGDTVAPAFLAGFGAFFVGISVKKEIKDTRKPHRLAKRYTRTGYLIGSCTKMRGICNMGASIARFSKMQEIFLFSSFCILAKEFLRYF